MRKGFLILLAILFSTSLLAHEPPNFNSKDNCRKKLSMLKGISKLKGYDGGEIIKFNSYTGFDQRTVLIDGHLNNPLKLLDIFDCQREQVKFLLFTRIVAEDQGIMLG